MSIRAVVGVTVGCSSRNW